MLEFNIFLYPLSEVNDFGDSLQPRLICVNWLSHWKRRPARRDACFGGTDTQNCGCRLYAVEHAFQLMVDKFAVVGLACSPHWYRHSQTTLYIAKDGSLYTQPRAAFGGAQLTESIQSRYGLTSEEAMINKRTFIARLVYGCINAIFRCHCAANHPLATVLFFIQPKQPSRLYFVGWGSASIAGLEAWLNKNLVPAQVLQCIFKYDD